MGMTPQQFPESFRLQTLPQCSFTLSAGASEPINDLQCFEGKHHMY